MVSRRGIFLTFVLCGGIGAAETTELPTTPPGRHLSAFLDAYNSEGAEALRGFVEGSYQPGVDVEGETVRWLRHRSVYGPLRLHSVVVSSETTLRVFARGTVTKGWVELTVRMSRSTPDRLRTIAVGEGLRPQDHRSGDAQSTPRRVARRARAYLREVAVAGYFSGTVLIAKNERPILKEAFGAADVAYGTSNSVETRFNVGSVTKLFTATAVLQLAEQGKLALDDSAATHLPDYPGGLDPRIRIRHLLTHTSGMGRGAADAPIFASNVRTVEEWLALTPAEPEFEPGESVSYSNAAFIVLGAIIERVTGKDYFAYIDESVYRRAGMESSGTFELDRPVADLAVNYTHALSRADGAIVFDPERRRSAIFLNGLKGSPAGLSYTSVTDLLRFRNALLDNTLLGPDYTRTFLTPQVEIPGEPDSGIRMRYGYGWEVQTVGNTTSLGKSGGTWGASARFELYLEQGYTVIVLSNYDSIAGVVAGYLGELIGPG